MIVYSFDGKIIGDIEGGVFTKKVDGRIHRLNKPPAWAVDALAYDRDVRPNCHTVRIIDEHAEITYEASTKTFDRFMRETNRSGFGRQYLLTLNHWKTIGKGQGVML